jgi:hypothetical protein
MLIREIASLALFLILVLSVYIKEAQLITRFVFRRLRGVKGPSGLFTKPAIAVHAVALAGIACILYGIFIEPVWLDVRKVELTSRKLHGAGLRIVQISDLHSEPAARTEDRIAAIVNPLKPDIIVFTGDSVNTPGAIPLFKKTLSGLKAGIGKFAVTGNFDYWYLGGYDLFGDTGFRVLKNDTVKLSKGPDTFYISGLGFEKGSMWRSALARVPSGYYSIFLYHKPDLIEDIKGYNADLYLCGHTHGGQISLPVYGAVITFGRYGKRYESGEYKVGDTVLYVNRGLGLEGKAPIKARFCSRPEITVFDIRPGSGR